MSYTCVNFNLSPGQTEHFSSVSDFLIGFPKLGLKKPDILIRDHCVYTRPAHSPSSTPWKLTLIPS